MLRQVLFALSIVFAAMSPWPAVGAEPVHLRIGLVKFGAAAWEIDTMRSHGLDRAAGIVVDPVDLANPAAGEVALQAGGVDAILTDWLWVSRQRLAGRRITFVPHSAALGEILVPRDSTIRSLADLKGKRLGVAGGPLDKSWLLLRAFSRRQMGGDIANRATIVFAAPPLLSQELASLRVDAILTYWPFAARLAVHGFRSLATMDEVIKGLGFTRTVPMLGYAVPDTWIARHPGGLEKFLGAIREADSILWRSDSEWERLRPLTAAEDDATLVALRQRFRAGIRDGWDAAEQADASRLFALMAETGGADLTGGAHDIAAGTFWSGACR